MLSCLRDWLEYVAREKDPGPLTTITTSPGGAGAVSFPFDLLTAAEVTFDVMFRVVDNTTTPSLELRTACFQVTPR